MSTEVRHIKNIIIGGGPAGSTCGYMLAKASKESLIIEGIDFPRTKVCGGGLTPKCYRLIDKIFEDIKYEYTSIVKLEVYLGKKRSQTFQLSDEIRIICRKDFDNILLQSYINIGGEVLYARAKSIYEKEGKIFVTLADNTQLSCDKLIGADGANSIVRKYMQPNNDDKILLVDKTITDQKFENIKIYFDSTMNKGYLYLFPNPNGCVIGYGDLETSKSEFERLLKAKNLPTNDTTKGAYLPMGDNIEYPMCDNIILIGDAGGYVDSISGEGIFYAIQTGGFAAMSIINDISFKELNKGIIARMRKINQVSDYFYNKFVHYPLIYLCTSSLFHDRISRKINNYLSR